MRGRNARNSGSRAWMGIGIAALALAALTTLATVAPAAEQEDAESIAVGRVTYRVYCANCHGNDARGDGRIASLLTVEPSDLTRLAADNGGTFPADEVRKTIDGREEVRGHGMREMPIWGDVFQDDPGDAAAEKKAQDKIDDLVAFLGSIQAES